MYYIYKYVENDKIIYIGKTVNLRRRIQEHSKEEKFKKHSDALVYYFECASEADMTIYEIYYIYKYKPELNVTYNQRADSFINEVSLESKEWKKYEERKKVSKEAKERERKEYAAQKKEQQRIEFERVSKWQEEHSLRTPMPFKFDENYSLKLQINGALNPPHYVIKNRKSEEFREWRIYYGDYFNEFVAPTILFLSQYLREHKITKDWHDEKIVRDNGGFVHFALTDYYFTEQEYEDMITASFSFAREHCPDSEKIAKYLLGGVRANAPSKKRNTTFGINFIVEHYKPYNLELPYEVYPIQICQFYETYKGMKLSIPLQDTLNYMADSVEELKNEDQTFLSKDVIKFCLMGKFKKSS